MSIQVLGPLRVTGATLLSPRERTVLAVLVLRAGTAVSPEEIADALWGEHLPATWPKQVQAAVSRVRRVVGADHVITTPTGYRLLVDADASDAWRFEEEVLRGRLHAARGEPDRAVSAFVRALALWDGPAYAELGDWEPGRAEAERLAEVRRTVEEDLLEARLAVGEHRRVAADAEVAVSAEPLRERRWAALCLAQYRCGRQADALATLRRARRTLAEDLGVDLGPDLVRLEHDVLHQDPGLGPGEAPTRASDICPYKGLAAYDASDHAVFYGRDEEIRACLERLTVTPLLVLTGPSGSGKSSLLRAGVLAALERRGRRTVVVVPGAHPLATIDAALAREAGGVVAVDQMEELFLLQHDEDEVAACCRRLVDAVADGTTVLIAVRADQVSGLRTVPALGDLAERGLHLVAPLQGEALRAAIEGPAAAAGLRIEHGLVDLLLRDVAGQAGPLPLLSHALAETWRRRDGAVLTVEAYEESGGIAGAVARSAERLYENLRAADRHLCRSLLLRLVVPAPDGIATRRRLPLSSLGHEPGRERVLAELVGARLLTADRGTVEIAHEALVNAWPRLRSWLDGEGAGLRVMRHLVASAEGWEALGRPVSELYRGARLDATLEWRAATGADLTETEAAFLESSVRMRAREADEAQTRLRREARQARRLRGLLVASAVLLAVSLVATGLAVGSSDRATDRAAAARAARDESQLAALVSTSLALRSTDRSVAALLAVEAHHRWPESAGSLSALLGTFSASQGFLGHTWVGQKIDYVGAGLAGALLPGGRTAVVGLQGGARPVVLDLGTGVVDDRFPEVALPGGPGSAIRISADGSVAVHYTVGSARTRCWFRRDPLELRPFDPAARPPGCATLTTYDVASGAVLQGPVVLPWSAGEVALSPDGSRVAVTNGMDGAALVVDARSGHALGLVPALPSPALTDWGSGGVAFGSDGALWLGSAAGPVRQVDPSTGQVLRTVEAPELSSNTNLWAGPDGLVVGTGHRHLVGLDTTAAAGEELLWSQPISSNRRSSCPWAAFSAAAGRLWCGTFHGLIEERDLATGEPVGRTRTTHFGNVGWMEPTADGRELVVFSVSTPAVLRWRLDGSGPVARKVAEGRVLWDGYEPGGEHLVTAEPFDDEPTRFAVWDPGADALVREVDGLLGVGWVAPGRLGGLEPEEEVLVSVDVRSGGRDLLPGVDLDTVDLLPAPDGSVFLAREDGRVTRVDPVTGRDVARPLRGHGWPTAVSADAALSTVVVTTLGPDPTSLADDVTVRFDAATGEAVGTPLRGWFHSVLHEDLLVVARAKSIALYDARTFEQLGELPGSPGEVDRLDVSANGALLAVTSRDQSVILYDLATGSRLGDPMPTAAPPGARAAALRSDGSQLAVAAQGGVVVWDLDPEALMQAACRVAGRELTASEWDTYLLDYGPPRSTCGG